MQRRLRIALAVTAATGALALGAGTAFAASPVDGVQAPEVSTAGIDAPTGALNSSAHELGDSASDLKSKTEDLNADDLHGKAQDLHGKAQDLHSKAGDLKKLPGTDATNAVPGVAHSDIDTPALPDVQK